MFRAAATRLREAQVGSRCGGHAQASLLTLLWIAHAALTCSCWRQKRAHKRRSLTMAHRPWLPWLWTLSPRFQWILRLPPRPRPAPLHQ